MVYDFSPESMLAAGVPPEDINYYKSARIAYSDSRSWLRIISIQAVLATHQSLVGSSVIVGAV